MQKERGEGRSRGGGGGEKIRPVGAQSHRVSAVEMVLNIYLCRG